MDMLGEIQIFAGEFAPRGWAYCDGAMMRLFDNQALYSLIGTTYGGDGSNTFALPNMPDSPSGRYIICTQGYFPFPR